jgi:L-2-hydroxyglutarate oxidase
MIACGQKYSIPYDICKKIVVATSLVELSYLEKLYQRGLANGPEGLRFLKCKEIHEIEPHCVGLRVLFVPQTVSVDYSIVAKNIPSYL